MHDKSEIAKATAQDLREHGKTKGQGVESFKDYWQHGGESNQINALIVSLHKNKILTTRELNSNLDTFLGHIGSNVPLSIGWETFKKAIHKYNAECDGSLRVTDELKSAFDRKFSQRLIIPSVYEKEDLKRMVDSYDTFLVAKKDVAKTSDALLGIVSANETDAFSCENIIIGAGDNAVTLWTEKFTDQYKTAEQSIAKGSIPDVLVLAEGVGSWGKSDYMFEQSHNLLERAGQANPADFTTQKTYQSNARVNARHLDQANHIIRAKTGMPILPSSVSVIEKKDKHTNNWPEKYKDFEYKLKIELNGDPSKVKTIYTNNIDVCSGLGTARDVFPALFKDSEESKTIQKKLTSYDAAKGFTPLVSGNDFMLTPREEKKAHEANRRILVLGGGGGAAAVFRKAAFLEDTGKTFANIGDSNPPNTDIRWIARAGFGDVILAQQAQEAVDWGKKKGLLNEGTITSVVEQSDGSLLATFKMYERIEGGSDLKSDDLKMKIQTLEQDAEKVGDKNVKIEKVTLGNVEQYVIARTQSIVCDQIVAAAGQDSALMKTQFLKDLGKLDATTIDGIVTGIHSADEKIQFHGAAAIALGDWAVSSSMQSDLDKANAPQDASVAGIMPPAREQVRTSQNKDTEADLVRHLNLNTVNPKFLAKVLEAGGLNTKEVTQFMDFVHKQKKSRSTGISRDDIEGYIKENNLAEQIDLVGLSSIAIKNVMASEQTLEEISRQAPANPRHGSQVELLLGPSEDIPEIEARNAASPGILHQMELKTSLDKLQVKPSDDAKEELSY